MTLRLQTYMKIIEQQTIRYNIRQYETLLKYFINLEWATDILEEGVSIYNHQTNIGTRETR